MPGRSRHYIRIAPVDLQSPGQPSDPDNAPIQIANGGGRHPARNVVSGDFLELVRLGVRDAHDPVILDSLAVIDRVLKRNLPQGPAWRRYNHDCYGQKDDGSAFDGTGTGRCWPLLTGERGHYELEAGHNPLPFLQTLEGFANEGGMLPEQVWDTDDLPEARMWRGRPTGSAMPLCWAHAEYLTLARSWKDGVGFDRIQPAYERYARGAPDSVVEMWTQTHPPRQIAPKKTLRLLTPAPATVHWSADEWRSVQDLETKDSGLGCWFIDLPSARFPAGTKFIFTFRWKDRWESRDFIVEIR